MFAEFSVGVVEEEVIMDDGLAGNDAEEVDKALGGGPHVATDGVAAGGGVKDGEIDIGIGVGGVKEAAESDGVGGLPELEDAVDVDEVVEEASVLVPALAGAD